MTLRVRIARPTKTPVMSLRFYVEGLGGTYSDKFRDHAGYSGDIVLLPGCDVEIELVHGRAMRHLPRPTAEDALVLYSIDPGYLSSTEERMSRLGIQPVKTENPYWHDRAKAWRDPDGYITILCRDQILPERHT